MTRVAVVQSPPVLLDKRATLERAVAHVDEAARGGARFVAFPETFIPGYPTWIWRLRPGRDMTLIGDIHARLIANAIDLSRDELAPLQEAARRNETFVLCGINEIDGAFSRGTLYNTVVLIGADGEVKNRHRKLMPTNPERMVWGTGDAQGLRAVETPLGRVAALICWENYMPLARYALYADGMEILFSPTWDSGDGWIGTLQHIAREGRCFVVGCGTALEASDIPADFPARAELFPDADEWINDGDSVIVAPGGKLLAGPMRRQKGLLFADLDRAAVAPARRVLDVTGHYARADVFQLHVRRAPLPPVIETDR
jgi:nitrilase